MGDTSRVWGGLLCLALIFVAIIFLWGISIQSYWALAIPVLIGFLGVLGLGFWVGWTILTIKTTPPAPEPTPGLPERKSQSANTEGQPGTERPS